MQNTLTHVQMNLKIFAIIKRISYSLYQLSSQDLLGRILLYSSGKPKNILGLQTNGDPPASVFRELVIQIPAAVPGPVCTEMATLLV